MLLIYSIDVNTCTPYSVIQRAFPLLPRIIIPRHQSTERETRMFWCGASTAALRHCAPLQQCSSTVAPHSNSLNIRELFLSLGNINYSTEQLNTSFASENLKRPLATCQFLYHQLCSPCFQLTTSAAPRPHREDTRATQIMSLAFARIRATAFARSSGPFVRAFSSTPQVSKSVIDSAKDAAKVIDRTVADVAVKGIEKGRK